MNGQRVLFIINDASFFISHRLPLAIAAKEEGYEVHVATPETKVSVKIKEAGLFFHAIPLSRSGKNPLNELKSLIALYSLLRTIKPDLVHLVTIKPIIYGGIIARILNVPAVVAAVSGLGYLFTSSTRSTKFLRSVSIQFYRFALRHDRVKIIFQNLDDQQLFLQNKICSSSQTVIIRGSGVDLLAYNVVPEQTNDLVVVLIARLLKDKGVVEYVTAAKILKSAGIQARFLLIGDADEGNPAFINQSMLTQWQAEGDVELLGFREDIAQLIKEANLVVLPSYREGLPKILMEAAACGRAVITTDVPGCRDAIEPNRTGLLVPARDVNALALAMKQLLEDSEYRQELGKAGRQLAERAFAIEQIVAAHVQIYNELGSLIQEYAL